MSESELICYQDWVDDLSMIDLGAVVLWSRIQNWPGLEVVQIHHHTSQAIVPAFQNHLLLLHLAPSSHFVAKIEGQTYKQRETRTGNVSILPAAIASEWYWGMQPQKNSLHLALDAEFVKLMTI
jgi:hypothetical protein